MKIQSPFSRSKFAMLGLLLSTVIVQGCSDDDDNDDTETMVRAYSITVTNLTNNQPFSPIAVLLHDDNQILYEPGVSASNALEKLAESGDNSDLISSVDSAVSGAGLLTPGSSETVMVEDDAENFQLTLLTMPVNTNDGFVGLSSVNLSGLNINGSLKLYAKVYDAGTENNSEAASDVPGQSGEGYNTQRDDRDFVTIHPGVIGMEDGLTSSALDATHRFDNPGAKIVITRTK